MKGWHHASVLNDCACHGATSAMPCYGFCDWVIASLQTNKASEAVQHAAGVTEHAKQEVRALVL